MVSTSNRRVRRPGPHDNRVKIPLAGRMAGYGKWSGRSFS